MGIEPELDADLMSRLARSAAINRGIAVTAENQGYHEGLPGYWARMLPERTATTGKHAAPKPTAFKP